MTYYDLKVVIIMVKWKLHLLLAEKRMSRKQLSELTNIRQATISSYCNETAKHIVVEHISLICKALNCKISDLIEYIDEEQN